jgi:hypothetical protein
MPRPVRARRHRPGDRLRVDVALIRQRQPVDGASRSPSAWIDVPAITVACAPPRRPRRPRSAPRATPESGRSRPPARTSARCPATRSLPPREAVSWTRPTSASMLVGRTIRCGVQRTSPDQLVQLGLRPNTAPMVSGAHAKQKPSPRYVGTRSRRSPSGAHASSTSHLARAHTTHRPSRDGRTPGRRARAPCRTRSASGPHPRPPSAAGARPPASTAAAAGPAPPRPRRSTRPRKHVYIASERPPHHRQREARRRQHCEASYPSNSTGPYSPEPAASSVTDASSRVDSRLPVPPPLTNRSTCPRSCKAATIAARRARSSRSERRLSARTTRSWPPVPACDPVARRSAPRSPSLRRAAPAACGPRPPPAPAPPRTSHTGERRTPKCSPGNRVDMSRSIATGTSTSCAAAAAVIGGSCPTSSIIG